MRARITGENEERIGLYVYDNDGVEHWMEIGFDGQIKYHDPEQYASEPQDRTRKGGENIGQARRYAQ